MAPRPLLALPALLALLFAMLLVAPALGQPNRSSRLRRRRREKMLAPATASAIETLLSQPVQVDSELSKRMKEDFDWRAYLEFNADLITVGINTQRLAEQHYLLFGRAEGRVFPERHPQSAGLRDALNYLRSHTDALSKVRANATHCALVVYHIDWPAFEDSLDVAANNVRLFLAAATSDSEQARPTNFYWINVVGGADNPLYALVNTRAPNIAVLSWSAVPSDMFAHWRTLELLPDELPRHVGMLLFLNSHTRGPLADRERGAWVRHFQALLAPNVGVVGATVSCEGAPHVQTHAFGIPTSILSVVKAYVSADRPLDSWLKMLHAPAVAFSTMIREQLHMRMASLQYLRHAPAPSNGGVFGGTCIRLSGRGARDPARWCDVDACAVLFVRFGGPPFRAHGALCAPLRRLLTEALRNASASAPEAGYVYPEALTGGHLRGAYRDYALEDAREAGHAHFNALYQFAAPVSTPASAPAVGATRGQDEDEEADDDLWVDEVPMSSQPPPALSTADAASLRVINGLAPAPSNATAARVCLLVKCCGPDRRWDEAAGVDAAALAAAYEAMYVRMHLAAINGTAVPTDAPGLREHVRAMSLPELEELFLLNRVRGAPSLVRQLLQAMHRQTDPRWRLFFFFGDRTSALPTVRAVVDQALARYGDSRVESIPVPPGQPYPQASGGEREYGALLDAYRHVFAQKDCAFVSLTNVHVTLGSDVVRAVLAHLGGPAQVVAAPADGMQGVYENQHAVVAASMQTQCTQLLATLGANPFAYAGYPALARSFQNVLSAQFNPLYRYATGALLRPAYPSAPFTNFVYMHGNTDITASMFLRNPQASAAGPVAGTGVTRAKEMLARMFAALHAPRRSPRVHPQELRHFFAPDAVAQLPLAMQTTVFLYNSPLRCVASQNVWVDHAHLAHVHCVSARAVEAYFAKYPHPGDARLARQGNERYYAVHANSSASRSAGAGGRGGSGGKRRRNGFFELKLFTLFDKRQYEANGHKCLRLTEEGRQVFAGAA